jgi:Protein of unknown function (DUF2934)
LKFPAEADCKSSQSDVDFLCSKNLWLLREDLKVMPSRICCAEEHPSKGIPVHNAALAIAEGRSIGACKKCGKPLQYRVDHVYAGDPRKKEHTFIVTRAVGLGTRPARHENGDPFLLVLRDIETGKELILPSSWATGQSTARGGQSTPLLSFEEWKSLFRRLDAAFDELEDRIRLRAYEMYEQRGRAAGHDLDDWLRAEAELTEKSALRAAA